MMTPIVLQAAVDEAAKAEVAKVFDMLVVNLIDKDENAGGRFKAGLARIQQAYAIAEGVINAL